MFLLDYCGFRNGKHFRHVYVRGHISYDVGINKNETQAEEDVDWAIICRKLLPHSNARKINYFLNNM